jgi:hypothetical protein
LSYEPALAEQLIQWTSQGRDKIPLDDRAASLQKAYKARVQRGRDEL